MRRTVFLLFLFSFSAPAGAEEADVPRMNPSIQEFFNGTTKETMSRVDDFYAKDALFRDPVGEIRGASAIKAYYARLYENVLSIRFDFESEIGEGDEHVVTWVMHLRHKAIEGGKEISLPGASHIRFANGKAVYHRDYFDMGAFVYEHIPVLGAGVRYVKKKVAGH